MMSDIVQRSPEWFEARLGIVTASRVSDLMAKTKSGYSTSRDNYMAQLITERLTGKPTVMYENEAMRWGTETEPLARQAYEADTLNVVTETGLIMHPNIKHMGASPDGLVQEKGQLEIKCPNTATHINTIMTAIIDGKYLTQIFSQMACTGREWCDFVSFDPRMPEDMQLYIDRVQRSDNAIKEIETEVIKFLAELEAMVDKLFERRPAGREAYIERWRHHEK